MTSDLIPVPVGDCRCPGAPHGDGDIVYLAPVLSMVGGMAARAALTIGFADETSREERTVLTAEALYRVWLHHGILDWTFVDEEGDPVPVSMEAATRLLPYAKGGRLVADAADDLYVQDVVDPLVEAMRAAEKEIARLKRSRRGLTPSTATSGTSSTPGSSTPSSRKKQR